LVLKNTTIEDAKNYYPVVSSIITSLVGLTGILAGSFYYFDKERRTKLNLLRQSIEKYDDLVMDIIELVVKSDEELNLKRNSIIRVSDQIELMLDDDTGFLPFSRKSAKKILSLNSFVDKCELIMRAEYNLLSQAELIGIKDIYMDIAKTAKIVCYVNCR